MAKVENMKTNINMNINIPDGNEMGIEITKNKFDNWDIINYVQDYINKYKKDIADLKELESQDRSESSMDYLTEIHKKLTLEKGFLLILENISKYARANEKQTLEEIYQIDEKTGEISKANDIDDKALDEIFNYCERNIEILESINSNPSDYSSGIYSTCRYIKEIIDIAESKKVEE